MRRIVIFLLALLSCLPLLAATCVTSSNQHSDAGPWTGEIRNDGDHAVFDVKVRADITDATGFSYTTYAPTCPSHLDRGEVGTFEVFSYGDSEAPLKAALSSVASEFDEGWMRPDVRFDVIERDPARRYSFVRLTNTGQTGYSFVRVCANLRSPAGELLEVGSAYALPDRIGPGQSTVAIIYFNRFPIDSLVEFVPQAIARCCDVRPDPDPITVESTRVVRDAAGKRFMLVEATSTNTSGADRTGAQVHAYIDGSAGDRTDYVTAGCNGVIPDGATAPTSFLIPVPEGIAHPSVVVSPVESYVMPAGNFFALEIRDVHRSGNTVSGTVINPAAEHLTLAGACLVLRDRAGRLVGSAAVNPQTPLDPGESTHLEAIVASTGDPVRAEIIAYGDNFGRLPPIP